MSDPEASLAALQEVLLRGERRRLEELDRKIERMSRAADVEVVAQVLPAAVRRGQEQGRALDLALAPTIEAVLEESVRRRPQKLADALFPIFGPAMRAAIANAIRGMVQSLNQVLEHSFSLRGLRWRIEAWRAGVPFAEVVLLHSLIYRVEEVFLIHAETGLLLQHHENGVDAVGGAGGVRDRAERGGACVADAGSETADASVLSGMLTAIQDFARDSFAAQPGATLEQFRVGDREVLVAAGSAANLALVVRGEPPAALADTARAVVAEIHAEFGPELADFRGEASDLQACRPLLELCFAEQYQAPASSPVSWLLLALPVVVLALLLGLRLWEGSARRNLVEALRAEPGIAAVSPESPWIGWPPWEHWGQWSVAGVRDPLARAPHQVWVELERRPREPRWDFAAMAGSEPEFVLRRAERLLRPPETVQLACAAAGSAESTGGAVLRVSGQAHADWAAEARRWGVAVAGVERVDCSELEILPDLAELQRRIEARVIIFGVDQDSVSAAQDAIIGRLAADLRQWLDEARRGGHECRVSVVGSTDEVGDPEYNRQLSRRRAESLAGALRSRGIAVAAVLEGRQVSSLKSGRAAAVRLQLWGQARNADGVGASTP
jgi:OOP family OmpA-OmpF porin